MKQRRSLGFFIVLAALAIAGGVGLARQWQDAMSLRAELAVARIETSELARLRAENDRLREKQIPVAELEALRADHAALPRLRAELEALKKRTPVVGP
jgi:hypothetical protein